MTILIIAGWDANNHPNRINTKATQAEADVILTTLADNGVTEAFSVTDPGVDMKYIVVDPKTNTITVDTTAQKKDIASNTARTELQRLENQVTNRRIRDAINDTENPKAWMATQESLIKVQREIIKSR